ncbi:hypothetical protein WJR50_21295 [Catalinimonas sp. 4WD22]|uniref:hypothetical protein n=1 Tax=Catalinimonas locisalis TaxID=3133978 RepID=UPI0031015854
MKIAHIINPVKVTSSSDLHVAQPITFESMRVAKEVAEKQNSDLQISLLSTQYAEDHEIIPDYFHKTSDLKRSVLDFGSFRKSRKLPLLKDILDKLIEAPLATDYYIYTNVDIALIPHFYLSIKKYIEGGYDAFVINRRTITDRYTTINDLPLMYAEIGEQHPGYDCFVFPAHIYNKFVLHRIIIGAAKVGLGLYLNMRVFSNNFKEFSDQHLTFHLGNDKVWKDSILDDYKEYNSVEFEKIRKQLTEITTKTDAYIKEAFPVLRA